MRPDTLGRHFLTVAWCGPLAFSTLLVACGPSEEIVLKLANERYSSPIPAGISSSVLKNKLPQECWYSNHADHTLNRWYPPELNGTVVFDPPTENRAPGYTFGGALDKSDLDRECLLKKGYLEKKVLQRKDYTCTREEYYAILALPVEANEPGWKADEAFKAFGRKRAEETPLKDFEALIATPKLEELSADSYFRVGHVAVADVLATESRGEGKYAAKVQTQIVKNDLAECVRNQGVFPEPRVLEVTVSKKFDEWVLR